MRKGAVGNVGAVLRRRYWSVVMAKRCADDFVLTVEIGPVGGITSSGLRRHHVNNNTRAIRYDLGQFDFTRGGLDVCYFKFCRSGSTR